MTIKFQVGRKIQNSESVMWMDFSLIWDISIMPLSLSINVFLLRFKVFFLFTVKILAVCELKVVKKKYTYMYISANCKSLHSCASAWNKKRLNTSFNFFNSFWRRFVWPITKAVWQIGLLEEMTNISLLAIY